jgi:hypothetical protein
VSFFSDIKSESFKKKNKREKNDKKSVFFHTKITVRKINDILTADTKSGCLLTLAVLIWWAVKKVLRQTSLPVKERTTVLVQKPSKLVGQLKFQTLKLRLKLPNLSSAKVSTKFINRLIFQTSSAQILMVRQNIWNFNRLGNFVDLDLWNPGRLASLVGLGSDFLANNLIYWIGVSETSMDDLIECSEFLIFGASSLL